VEEMKQAKRLVRAKKKQRLNELKRSHRKLVKSPKYKARQRRRSERGSK